MRIVVRVDLAQGQPRAVVLPDDLHGTRRIVDGDRIAAGDHVEPIHGIVVLAYIIEAFGRSAMIVERDAGADHVDERRPVMGG